MSNKREPITTIDILGEKAEVTSIKPSRVPGKDVLDVWVSFDPTLGDSNMLAGYFCVDEKDCSSVEEFIEALKEDIKERYQEKLEEQKRRNRRKDFDEERRERLREKARKLEEELS